MTVAEIQEAVRAAGQAGGRVTARGFGTHAREAPEGVRVVDTRGLDRIVDYDPADLTVTVEAGCPVAVLDAALGAHGQWLPVDVALPEKTTVGGMIALGLAGPLRQAYGTLRDQVIGIEWVGGEGQMLRSGGRVVKNVAGYDLMKLHVGARGRFGVVTQATFKVRPRGEAPATTVAWAPASTRVAAVSDGVARIRRGVEAALDPWGVFAVDREGC